MTIDVVWAQLQVPSRTLFYLLPLVAAVSLVYSATRHEQWSMILRRALRLGMVILGFMAVIFGVIVGVQVYPYATLAVIVLAVAVLVVVQRR